MQNSWFVKGQLNGKWHMACYGQVELMAPSDAVIDTRSFASAEALGAHLNSLV